MNEDDLKYRRCQMPGCDYKELRGSRQGAFIAGKFVCDACYAVHGRPSEEIIREQRDTEWRF
jgi:hypothetical protein